MKVLVSIYIYIRESYEAFTFQTTFFSPKLFSFNFFTGLFVYNNDAANRQKLNISITVLTKEEALLHWWPKDALIDKDFEVVFMPEHAR